MEFGRDREQKPSIRKEADAAKGESLEHAGAPRAEREMIDLPEPGKASLVDGLPRESGRIVMGGAPWLESRRLEAISGLVPTMVLPGESTRTLDVDLDGAALTLVVPAEGGLRLRAEGCEVDAAGLEAFTLERLYLAAIKAHPVTSANRERETINLAEEMLGNRNLWHSDRGPAHFAVKIKDYDSTAPEHLTERCKELGIDLEQAWEYTRERLLGYMMEAWGSDCSTEGRSGGWLAPEVPEGSEWTRLHPRSLQGSHYRHGDIEYTATVLGNYWKTDVAVRDGLLEEEDPALRPGVLDDVLRLREWTLGVWETLESVQDEFCSDLQQEIEQREMEADEELRQTQEAILRLHTPEGAGAAVADQIVELTRKTQDLTKKLSDTGYFNEATKGKLVHNRFTGEISDPALLLSDWKDREKPIRMFTDMLTKDGGFSDIHLIDPKP